jgi:Na+-driven multidrug efflux pump
MITWGAVYGVIFGLVVLIARPWLPGLFAVAPHVRDLLLALLIIVAVQQPAAGVVFVLDGVLIGAGDQDYLAVTGLVNLAIFAVAAAAVVASHGGLIALWLAFSVWMLARLATLTWRARGSRWLVTGAVRVKSPAAPPPAA